MKIEIYSDVVCPWCFIGKRRLDQVLETATGEGVHVVWRPYQLYPNLPDEGLDRGDFLRARYGERADRAKIPERIRVEAEDVGIPFDYGAIGRMPNTLDAHRLLGRAEEEGRQHALAEVLFRYYFCDGRDVGDLDELVAAAVEVRMEADATRAYLESDADVEATRTAIRGALDVGVAGVPSYRLAESYLLPGAQSADAMRQIIERAKERWSASS